MHTPLFLTLASALLIHALPASLDTSPNTEPNDLHHRDNGSPTTPALPYPSGKNAASCPVRPGPNPWATSFNPKKRSLITSLIPRIPTSSNLRRDPPSPYANPSPPSPASLLLCQQVASCSLDNWDGWVGTTARLNLLIGATYVFSWAVNQVITYISINQNGTDTGPTDLPGRGALLQSVGRNLGTGTMTLQLQTPGGVYLQMWPEDYDVPISGELAVFVVANGLGVVNPPPPSPQPPARGGGGGGY